MFYTLGVFKWIKMTVYSVDDTKARGTVAQGQWSQRRHSKCGDVCGLNQCCVNQSPGPSLSSKDIDYGRK